MFWGGLGCFHGPLNHFPFYDVYRVCNAAFKLVIVLAWFS